MMTMWQRMDWARQLPPVQPSYCIAWEDPANPDAPVAITTPSPQWLAMAMHGWLLPPLEAYHHLPLRLTLHDGRKVDAIEIEAQEYRRSGAVVREEVLPHHRLHTADPVGPMTEREAMDYLLRKDVPARVWAVPHNRPMYRFVLRSQTPTNRATRNAWRLETLAA